LWDLNARPQPKRANAPPVNIHFVLVEIAPAGSREITKMMETSKDWSGESWSGRNSD